MKGALSRLFPGLQRLGGALMLPIAVLPVAGLLLRLGQPDLLDLAPVAAAGDAIFSNLGLLFAIGVAVGLAREHHGAAGLAAVVCYLVATKGTEVLIAVPAEAIAGFTDQARDLAAGAYKARELAKLSVPAGILSGLLAGWLYNRYSDIRLPSWLAFFGGRRFVPIVSGVAGLAVAAAFGWGWPALEHGMDVLSHAVLGAGDAGLFVYGVLNRALIVTGLHHILNNVAWFLLGDFNGVTGDLKRFFAGDPQAGAFMAGFFPVMMFGLPAACLAMYHAARPERRRAVGGLYLSMALTSFLTGVTEPVEFTFMFIAPVLYVVHALLTGLGMVVMNVLDVRLGFSFSAGLFDYVLNFDRATHPLRLLPVGALYFAAYYGAFRFCIAALKLKTPGREAVEHGAAQGADTASRAVEAARAGSGADGAAQADAFIQALGGPSNLLVVDACTTRLRLEVSDPSSVSEQALRQLGARGVVRPSDRAVQVILGPIADQVAGDIRTRLRTGGHPNVARPVAGSQTPTSTDVPEGAAIPIRTVSGLLDALGGCGNVRAVEVASSRIRVAVADARVVSDAAIRALGLRGVARPGPDCVHVLVGPGASRACEVLRELLGTPGRAT